MRKISTLLLLFVGALVWGQTPEVQFDAAYGSVNEDGGSIQVTVTISEAPTVEGTVDIVLVSGGTAVQGVDFEFDTDVTVTFPIGSTNSQSITVPIIDDADDTSDLFFILELDNDSNLDVGAEDVFSVYILDDDTEVPAGDQDELGVEYLTSYLVDADGTAEISAFDAGSQRLFVTNGDKLEILDMSDPEDIQPISTVDFSAIGDGIQSVAVFDGLYALAVSAPDPTDNGFVLVADVENTNGIQLEVGPLPDMVTFTPDGTKVIVANEGEPNDDYSVDPQGSISIIDVSGGLEGLSQDNVTTVGFTAFDGQEDAFNAAGIRVYGPGASVSQDLEPEYIAVSDDSQFAYVSLQENNAYAVVDLNVPEVTEVIPFGLKDHSAFPNTIDVSDETDFIFDANWPIYGMYMPDAITYYTVDGTGYIVTANEGDAREYDTFEEERKIDDDDYILDPVSFPNSDILELESNLAEINVTNASGDTDGDGDFDQIHVFGARSFSIFNAETGALVYDSGNDFEVITANDPIYGGIFNASNSNNNFKNRSDNKGPEPEGVIVQEIGGEQYAFILLERIGGVMVYNVTDPANPVFLQYENSRDATPGGDEAGDLAPEGVIFVAPADNATENGLLVISNEESATLSLYTITNSALSVADVQAPITQLGLYPNPANDRVFLSIPGNYRVYDLLGREVKSVVEASYIEIADLNAGTYIVRSADGLSAKLIKR